MIGVCVGHGFGDIFEAVIVRRVLDIVGAVGRDPPVKSMTSVAASAVSKLGHGLENLSSLYQVPMGSVRTERLGTLV